jgi:hypothetical protein
VKAQIHLLKLGKLKFIRCLEQLLHFRTLVIFWSYQDPRQLHLLIIDCGVLHLLENTACSDLDRFDRFIR